ncbi:MAG TPA: hypothetical protein VFM98_10725 [Ramlibacter sp.]|uniref:hypothetical protein n=1 Tax=Ramlibacter sp. TaxID=1917967 RepID=UPI002D7FF1A5|nr:hypothetical protein [Ramlibacter sp.]HET8746070.1 hypothetical protein [Ramlibacter sp.]
MPEDRTPIDHGLAHPQPERGRIPQPKPKADEDLRELVPDQPTHEEKKQPGVGGHTNFVQTPD